jgi:hypothetical protein
MLVDGEDVLGGAAKLEGEGGTGHTGGGVGTHAAESQAVPRTGAVRTAVHTSKNDTRLRVVGSVLLQSKANFDVP